MSCPTCDHTMQALGKMQIYWCPRCGTIKTNDDYAGVPTLVGKATRLCDTADSVMEEHEHASLAPHVVEVRESIGVRDKERSDDISDQNKAVVSD